MYNRKENNNVKAPSPFFYEINKWIFLKYFKNRAKNKFSFSHDIYILRNVFFL